MRTAGCVFAINGNGPSVKFPASYPSSSQVLEALQAHRNEVIGILLDEAQRQEEERAAAVEPPAPAPWAQVEPTPVGPATEPRNTAASEPAPTEPAPVRGVAQPAPEPQQPRAELVAGASSWSPSRGAVIRERLGQIPAGVRVAIYGDPEARSKRGGLPTGVAAIARVALLGRDVDLVTADGLEEVLGRVGYLIVFHSALERSVGTAAVVEMARTRGILVEIISGTVAQEAPR
jgi:hypothetical protein